MDQHVLKITNESPEPVRRKKIGGTVAYNIAWGPNEYTPEGNLHDYEYTKALAKITTPTLITSGTDDLCTPLVAKTMYNILPNRQWELFENCGHMPFVQKTEEYLDLLINCLNSHD